MTPRDEPQDQKPPTLWQAIASVAASFFGVQSSRARRRDFTKGRPLHFIVIGLLMTAIFIAVVVLAVRIALKSAGM
jgi:hypothetical protein